MAVVRFTSDGIRIVSLETKIEYLRKCLDEGNYEDAMGHCLSLFAFAHKHVDTGLTLKQALLYYKGSANEIDEPPLKQLARQAE